MKITGVFIPIKDCFVNVRRVFVPRSQRQSSVAAKGYEILADQNKTLVKAPNQVEPLKKDFNHTKEMFGYAKERCMSSLKGESPYEYTVIMDKKHNKVIAEYTGDADCCSISNLSELPINSEDTVLMHSHPDSYPLSGTDVKTLLSYNVNQVIAVDKNGQFSLIARRADVPCAKMKSKAVKEFTNDCMANCDDYYSFNSKELLKHLTHDTLTKHSDRMGLKYVTNYGYLKNGFFNKG